MFLPIIYFLDWFALIFFNVCTTSVAADICEFYANDFIRII